MSFGPCRGFEMTGRRWKIRPTPRTIGEITDSRGQDKRKNLVRGSGFWVEDRGEKRPAWRFLFARTGGSLFQGKSRAKVTVTSLSVTILRKRRAVSNRGPRHFRGGGGTTPAAQLGPLAIWVGDQPGGGGGGGDQFQGGGIFPAGGRNDPAFAGKQNHGMGLGKTVNNRLSGAQFSGGEQGRAATGNNIVG